MALRKDEQQLKFTFCCVFVNLKHDPAHLLPIKDNPVGLGILPVDGAFDGRTTGCPG